MMRVLITRTRPGADRLATRLETEDIKAVLCPLLEVETMTGQASLDKEDGGLILTSAAALPGAPTPDHMATLPVYCVGRETARQATLAGYKNVVAGADNGKSLARMIARNTPDLPKSLLWCRGEVADEAISRKLSKAGISMRQHICYRTKTLGKFPAEISRDLASGAFDAVVFHSRRGAETFSRLAPELNPSLIAVCFSSAIASALKNLDFAKIETCARPNELSLLDLLRLHKS